MNNTPQTMTVVIPAGETIRVPVPGNWMQVMSCTVASFEFGFDNDPLTAGEPFVSYPAKDGFQSVRFRDSLGGAATIVVQIADTLPMDNRHNRDELVAIHGHLSAIDLDTTSMDTHLNDIETHVGNLEDHDLGSTNPFTYGNEKDCDAGAPTQLLAANAARRGCSFQAKHDNSGSVYIGSDNTVTSTKWAFDVVASQGYTFLNYKGALYGIGSANGQHIGVAEW